MRLQEANCLQPPFSQVIILFSGSKAEIYEAVTQASTYLVEIVTESFYKVPQRHIALFVEDKDPIRERQVLIVEEALTRKPEGGVSDESRTGMLAHTCSGEIIFVLRRPVPRAVS